MLDDLNWESAKLVLDVLVGIVILLGVPGGLLQYYRAVRREQLDREYGTYNALDEKFLEFQRLCLEYPALDIFDVPDARARMLDEHQKKQEVIAFTILFSIFERAFLMYSDQSTEIKQKQWSGWEEYIAGFCARDNFRDAYRVSGSTFDKDFEEFMERVLASTSRRAPPPA